MASSKLLGLIGRLGYLGFEYLYIAFSESLGLIGMLYNITLYY